MIALAAPSGSVPSWHAGFLALLPAIRNCLRVEFRELYGEALEDALQEAVANACVAYVRLVQRGLHDRIFASALARYAAAHFRSGRRVGTRTNVNDVLSPHAKRRRRIRVETISRHDSGGTWKEAVVEDCRTPVADQVAFRVDFPIWLKRLSIREREVAQALAIGGSTREVARQFDVSAGRISQLRRKLNVSWNDYQRDDVPNTAEPRKNSVHADERCSVGTD